MLKIYHRVLQFFVARRLKRTQPSDLQLAEEWGRRALNKEFYHDKVPGAVIDYVNGKWQVVAVKETKGWG